MGPRKLPAVDELGLGTRSTPRSRIRITRVELNRPANASRFASSVSKRRDGFRQSNDCLGPESEILDLLSQMMMAEQFSAHSTRFLGSHPGEIAQAFQRFQVNTRSSLPQSRKPYGFRLGDKLNSFRMAQSIRDEHGIATESLKQIDFRSYEDIIVLEQKIESDHAVDFMIHCYSLAPKNDRHSLEFVYSCTSTHAQLDKLHLAIRTPLTIRHFYETRFHNLSC